MNDRGRQLDQILHQYISYVKPAFEEFCLPVGVKATVIFYCFYSGNTFLPLDSYVTGVHVSSVVGRICPLSRCSPGCRHLYSC
jgi:hypothetical protein